MVSSAVLGHDSVAPNGRKLEKGRYYGSGVEKEDMNLVTKAILTSRPYAPEAAVKVTTG